MASDGVKVIGIIVIVIVILSIVGVGVYYVMTYNKFVDENEKIDSQWAQVQNQYQRKIDLIPQLISAVVNYTGYESSTLINITALRTQWMNAPTSEEQVNITSQLDYQINVMFEEYPFLQSSSLYSDLMTSIEGTENRIATERMYYNEAVQDYNSHIKRFPANWVARNNDFEERAYYSSPNAPAAP
jgi:LemA protein